MEVGEPQLTSGYRFAKSQMLAVLLGGRAGAGVWLLWRPGGWHATWCCSRPCCVHQEMVLMTSKQWSKLQCLPRPWQFFQGCCSFIFKTPANIHIQSIYDLLTELTLRRGGGSTGLWLGRKSVHHRKAQTPNTTWWWLLPCLIKSSGNQ